MRRLVDSVNVDLREKGLWGEEKQNWAGWRQLVRNIDPIGRRYTIAATSKVCHIILIMNEKVV